MTDYATIEALASRLCHDAGRNWYAKGCKRNHWRKKAAAKLSADDSKTLFARLTLWLTNFWGWLFGPTVEKPCRVCGNPDAPRRHVYLWGSQFCNRCFTG